MTYDIYAYDSMGHSHYYNGPEYLYDDDDIVDDPEYLYDHDNVVDDCEYSYDDDDGVDDLY